MRGKLPCTREASSRKRALFIVDLSGAKKGALRNMVNRCCHHMAVAGRLGSMQNWDWQNAGHESIPLKKLYQKGQMTLPLLN